MTLAALAVLALLQQPVPTAGDSAAGRPCTIVIDSIGGNYRQQVPTPGDTNRFAGGGVLAHCEGTGSTLSSDSVAMYGTQRRIDFIGHVVIRDTAMALDANRASYFLRDERLEARKNVVATNRHSGSVLRGPHLDYYRAVRGVRDTVEMFAASRPTVEYRQAADSGEPYIIVGDRMRFKGDDRVWAGGKVTVDRSDFASRSDSLLLDETQGIGVLVGQPRVEGKGGKTYTLVGTRIELGLAQREIRLVKALGQGKATGDDWTLTADTIHLLVADRKLQQAFAWVGEGGGEGGAAGAKTRAHAVSTLYTIDADSIAIDTPAEVLTESRAFRHALSRAKRDSATVAADVDWITGDSLTARFVQEKDSTGREHSRLQQILARGAARALTHHFDDRDSTAAPAINYSRGQRIAVLLRGAKVDHIVVAGDADGVHLEPRPTPPDTTKKKP
jgi:hypothetical protein